MTNIISRREAQSQGLNRYHSGKACPMGHIAERRTVNGSCVQCESERNLARYHSNPKKQELLEKRKEYKKKYRKEHGSQIAMDYRKRKGIIKQRTVFSHEKDELNRIYKERPEGHHVDHEIPLNHPEVCGLHCVANLQYLTAEDNLKKTNKFKRDDT